jgi:AcrR family transcriptional regulator
MGMARETTKAETAKPVSVPMQRGRRRTREERTEELRNKIFTAAAKVVGRYGYAEASVNRITEEAGIAQGTFYLYFESRQEMFDQLLPHVGADMIAHIGRKVAGAKTFFEVEEQGFRAFFDFLRTNPGFFRVLNEAEVAAPVAHANHMTLLTGHYVRSLQRSADRREIKTFEGKELEAIAYVFQSARSYLYMRFVKDSKKTKKLPDWVVETYMRLVRNGLK